MVSDETPTRKSRHGHHALIPAGLLIGLGVGLLVSHPAAGAIIGLGIGFLVSSFMCHGESPPEAAPACCDPKRGKWIMAFLGIVMILIGIGIVWAPHLVWPYFIAIVLVLLGIGLVIRGVGR